LKAITCCLFYTVSFICRFTDFNIKFWPILNEGMLNCLKNWNNNLGIKGLKEFQ
jgi:hypothetical protein